MIISDLEQLKKLVKVISMAKTSVVALTVH